MIKPLLQDDALLADIKTAAADTRGFHIWWLGQSGFLVQWQGRHLLMDPYLSDSLTKKYANTDKPHVRMTENVIAPQRLNFIDVVTSSHDHTDHFDPETLRPLLRANPKLKIVLPEANRERASQRLGRPPEDFMGMFAGMPKAVGNFRIQGIPAAHPEIETNEWDEPKMLGYVVDLGMKRIYHAGDTLVFDGLENWVRPFKADVAILPINGDKPERRVAGNMDGKQAAQLAKAMGARMAVPCHFEMFEFNTASPEEFVTECGRLKQPCKVLRAGERWSSTELPG